MFNIISLTSLLPILWLPVFIYTMWCDVICCYACGIPFSAFIALHCIDKFAIYVPLCAAIQISIPLKTIANKTLLTLELCSTLLIPNELTLIDMFIMKLTKIGFHLIRASADGVTHIIILLHTIFYIRCCSSIWNHYNPYTCTFTWLYAWLQFPANAFCSYSYPCSCSCSYLIAVSEKCVCVFNGMTKCIWCNWNFNCNHMELWKCKIGDR